MSVLVAISGLSGVATAHHGAELAVLEEYDLGHRGEGFLLGAFDFEKYGGIDELSSEVSFFYSPLPRIGLGVDVRFAEEEGGDWVYSSVTPKLQVQLSDPESDSRFRFGLSIGYQFANDLRRTSTVTTYEEVVRAVELPSVTRVERSVVTTAPVVVADPGDDGGPPCDPLFDLDCDAGEKKKGAKHGAGHVETTAATTKTTVTEREVKGGKREVRERVETTRTVRSSTHEGIHNHDSNQWVGRLAVEARLGSGKVVGNLIGVAPEGDQVLWGYGIGIRQPVTRRFGASLEAVGDFDSGGEHEVIGSVTWEAGRGAMLRLGVGVGLTPASPDMTVRTGLMWRF